MDKMAPTIRTGETHATPAGGPAQLPGLGATPTMPGAPFRRNQDGKGGIRLWRGLRGAERIAWHGRGVDRRFRVLGLPPAGLGVQTWRTDSIRRPGCRHGTAAMTGTGKTPSIQGEEPPGERVSVPPPGGAGTDLPAPPGREKAERTYCRIPAL